MDLQSAIIGLVCLAFFVVPVLYIQRKQKGKKIKLLQEFTDLARQQGLVISEYDFWDTGYATGIDPKQKKLFYSKKGVNKHKQVLVDLSKVEKCAVSCVSREVNGSKTIDNISLTFTHRKNLMLPNISLEFYNREESLNLSEELRLAEKWQAIVSKNTAVSASERVVVIN